MVKFFFAMSQISLLNENNWENKFQVMFRKIMGDPPVPMVAFTFTMLGFINIFLCWPITVGLYLTGAEVMPWDSLSWMMLLIACILMLGNYSFLSF